MRVSHTCERWRLESECTNVRKGEKKVSAQIRGR